MIIIFFIALFYIYKFCKNKLKIKVKSVYDNLYYKVRSNIDVLKSTYYLSYLRKVGIILLNNIDKKNLIFLNNFIGFNKAIKLINYIPINENIVNSKDTSYTINKGDKIILCIRSQTGSFYNLNEIIYIFIHELSHIICNEIGHTDKFYNINRFLIKEAIRLNLYKFKNYKLNPINYCGIKLNEYLF